MSEKDQEMLDNLSYATKPRTTDGYVIQSTGDYEEVRECNRGDCPDTPERWVDPTGYVHLKESCWGLSGGKSWNCCCSPPPMHYHRVLSNPGPHYPPTEPEGAECYRDPQFQERIERGDFTSPTGAIRSSIGEADRVEEDTKPSSFNCPHQVSKDEEDAFWRDLGRAGLGPLAGPDTPPPGVAYKHKAGKPRPSLIPLEIALDPGVYEYGAKKVTEKTGSPGDDNWRMGMPWLDCYDALFRHLRESVTGVDLDPESSIDHLHHARFWINALLYYKLHNVGEDNRKRKKRG